MGKNIPQVPSCPFGEIAVVMIAGVPFGSVALPFTDKTVLLKSVAFAETKCAERPCADVCADGIVSVT
jgi:hypothetical protein